METIRLSLLDLKTLQPIHMPRQVRYSEEASLLALIKLCSDIFSFYKEVKAGERDNYISQLAVINRQPPFQAVRDLTEQALSIDLRIKEILGDTPERMAWVSFTCGYAGFHIHTPRYRLKEVLSERSDAFSNQGVQYEVI